MLRRLLCCSVLVGALVVVPSASAAPGLSMGFHDDEAFQTASEADNATSLGHARQAGATVARFFLTWRDVEKSQPSSVAVAKDPSFPGYDWTRTDRTMRQMTAAGLQPIASIHRAPDWAEGPNRPALSDAAPRGTWRPSPTAFAAFATAVARRYSGTYPDPATPGATLPKLHYFDGWNEPNLSTYLAPQWRRSGGKFVPNSPDLYRGLINAFYKAVKGVDAKNVVISAGTAPFGDLEAGGLRMPAMRFYRDLFCLKGTTTPRPAGHCPTVSFDVVSHHPYPIGPPRRKARNADDVVVPDMGKINKAVSAALRARTIRPVKPKPLWATELSWDSKPDPDGLSLSDQAQYMEGAMYVLWKSGVDLITFWKLRDDAPRPSYDTTYQSGIFTHGATPAEDEQKPSYTAFRFPFTAYRSEGVARLWGMSPTPGSTVVIEAQTGGRWVTAATLKAGANRIFQGRLRVGRGTQLRARSVNDLSLTWTTF